MDKAMTIMKEFMEQEEAEEAAVLRFKEEMTGDDKMEFIHVLEKMLLFGPSSSMKSFARVLLDHLDDVPTHVRCRMLEYVYEADDPRYLTRLRQWLANEDMDIACRVQWIKQMSHYPIYEHHVEDWMRMVFHETRDVFYRNRIVMDAFRTYEDNGRFPVFIEIMREYRKCFDDPIMYKVAFAQNLIEKELEDTGFIMECLDELASVMGDVQYPFETQADVCDFFLNTENKHIKPGHYEKAEGTMRVLFRENMVSELSIYANRQNVHSSSIETSAQEVIQQLHEKYGLRPITCEKLQEWRAEMEHWPAYTEHEEPYRQKVSLCMNRIFFDKHLYGATKDTLSTIFGLVWRHIGQSEHQGELQKRLLEELAEGSGQCSTGIAVRLANTLSGYDDFMLKISYREAILSRVVALLNKKIMGITEESLQETLLHEMTLPHSEYTSRKNFLDFLRRNIPSIKEDLYSEYREYVSDTDFDLYLKQALVVYEG